MADEALVEQRSRMSGSAPTTRDAASSVQPPAKTLSPRNSTLLLWLQELVRPVDRRLERSLTGVDVAARLEEIDRSPRLSRIREGERAGARRRQLDRERKLVEATAELGDRRRSTSSSTPAASARSTKSASPSLSAERRDRPDGLGPELQALAARDEQLEGRAAGDQVGHVVARRPGAGARGCRGAAGASCRRARCEVVGQRLAGLLGTSSARAIAGITSVGSRSGASGTQKTPSG